jgi:hypothetical protein
LEKFKKDFSTFEGKNFSATLKIIFQLFLTGFFLYNFNNFSTVKLLWVKDFTFTKFLLKKFLEISSSFNFFQSCFVLSFSREIFNLFIASFVDGFYIKNFLAYQIFKIEI